jgi:hypothetical protein
MLTRFDLVKIENIDGRYSNEETETFCGGEEYA